MCYDTVNDIAPRVLRINSNLMMEGADDCDIATNQENSYTIGEQLILTNHEKYDTIIALKNKEEVDLFCSSDDNFFPS